MMTIDIDFDVFKELTRRRSSEEVTYNDVIRELLGLGVKKNVPSISSTTGRAELGDQGCAFSTWYSVPCNLQGSEISWNS